MTDPRLNPDDAPAEVVEARVALQQARLEAAVDLAFLEAELNNSEETR